MNFVIHSYKLIRLLSLTLVTFLVLMNGQAGAQQRANPPSEDVIRINTELVRTGVMVLDRQGHFVNGLEREQFELTIEGKPQPIS